MSDFLWAALVGYLLGSVPTGLLIGKWLCNIDIRQYGSKNIGTTNMFRTLGAKPASIVLLGDMGKGMLAVLFANLLADNSLPVSLTGGLAAVLGHNYPVFLNFKGGRGVATAFGVLCLLQPKVVMIVFPVWLAIVFLTRYVSLGSVVAAFIAPIAAWWFDYQFPLVLFTTFAAAFVIIRHKDNIRRLLAGTESKIKAGSTSSINKGGSA